MCGIVFPNRYIKKIIIPTEKIIVPKIELRVKDYLLPLHMLNSTGFFWIHIAQLNKRKSVKH